MFSSAFLIIVGLLSILFNAIEDTIFIGSWIFFTILIIGGVIYFNISGYAKN
jgi:hypothetical protein